MPWHQYPACLFLWNCWSSLSTGRISVLLETWPLQFRQKKNRPEYRDSIETWGNWFPKYCFCFCKQIFPPVSKLEILECCVHMLFLSSGNLAVIIISILICECCYNANYHCVFFKTRNIFCTCWHFELKYSRKI